MSSTRPAAPTAAPSDAIGADGLTDAQRAYLSARYAAATAEGHQASGAHAEQGATSADGQDPAPVLPRQTTSGVLSHLRSSARRYTDAMAVSRHLAETFGTPMRDQHRADRRTADARYTYRLAMTVVSVLGGVLPADDDDRTGRSTPLSAMHPIARASFVRGTAADAREAGYAADIVAAILAQDGRAL